MTADGLWSCGQDPGNHALNVARAVKPAHRGFGFNGG